MKDEAPFSVGLSGHVTDEPLNPSAKQLAPLKDSSITVTIGRSAFSPVTPQLQLFWDTVSMGCLKECAREYQLSILEGWTAPGINPDLFFGLIAHSTKETYARARARGASYDEAVRLAIRHCLESTGFRHRQFKCQRCGAVQASDEARILAFGAGVLPCLRCNAESMASVSIFLPWISDHKYKNRKNLVRTMVWYFDKYKDSEAKTKILSNGEPAVEVWFRFKLPLTTHAGEPFYITGHIDEIIEFAGSDWFVDLKTTKDTISSQFLSRFMPDNQMYQYAVGGSVAFDKPLRGGIIDGAQVVVGFSTFQRGFVEPTKAQLNEWLKDVQIWLKQAESYALADYWPMNDRSCNHYGKCQFRDKICSKDPAIRGALLRTHFVQRPWNPLKPRKKAGEHG